MHRYMGSVIVKNISHTFFFIKVKPKTWNFLCLNVSKNTAFFFREIGECQKFKKVSALFFCEVEKKDFFFVK